MGRNVAQSIYVGNLPDSVSEQELREMFAEHGHVSRVNKVVDQKTGRPRGFAFVDMDDDNAESAIKALNCYETQGRILVVKKAGQQ